MTQRLKFVSFYYLVISYVYKHASVSTYHYQYSAGNKWLERLTSHEIKIE